MPEPPLHCVNLKQCSLLSRQLAFLSTGIRLCLLCDVFLTPLYPCNVVVVSKVT